jgi:nucleoside-diphosphate-sugar epimerase
MKILLTGGTGFVGQAIRKSLHSRDQNVTVLSRNKVIKFDNENELSNIDLLRLNYDDFRKIVEPFDVIIHAAWYVNPTDYNVSIKNIEHMKASLELSRAIATYNNKSLIGLGTCLEYDLTPGILYPENHENPNNLYSACKLSYKNITKQIFQNTNNKFIWARLFYLYGEGEYPQRLYPSIKKAIEERRPLALSNGENIRDFIEVNNAADMIVNCLSLEEKFKIVNISSGQGQTIRDFVTSISGNFSHLMKFGTRNVSAFEAPVIVGGQHH